MDKRIDKRKEIECNIVAVRENGSVYVVKVEGEEKKKEIVKNKHKLKEERIFIEND